MRLVFGLWTAGQRSRFAIGHADIRWKSLDRVLNRTLKRPFVPKTFGNGTLIKDRRSLYETRLSLSLSKFNSEYPNLRPKTMPLGAANLCRELPEVVQELCRLVRRRTLSFSFFQIPKREPLFV